MTYFWLKDTSITRLTRGDFNPSKADDDILYKQKIFFTQHPTEKLLSSFESIATEERILKHSPRFIAFQSKMEEKRSGEQLNIL